MLMEVMYVQMVMYLTDGSSFLFYLPPNSPELNPAETLWCILKGKGIRPADY